MRKTLNGARITGLSCVLIVWAAIGTVDYAAAQAAKSTTPVTPIERGAVIDKDNLSPHFINTLAAIVRGVGYRCDSISAAVPHRRAFSDTSVNLTCNDGRYDYDIRDVGGKIEVKVKR